MIGAIVWVEHGGPEVKHRRHAGFGSRLVKTVLDGYGGVRVDLNSTGLSCFMLVDLDRPAFDETLNVATSTPDAIHAESCDWLTDR